MSIPYLHGYTWAEITREERFFCQHLFELIRSQGIGKFLTALGNVAGAPLDPNGPWEVGFEVCFYRDYCRIARKNSAEYSQKRTFDLVLFSPEVFLIIEAKAFQGHDSEQTRHLARDRQWVKELTQVRHVMTISLTSSRYRLPSEYAQYFDGKIYWRDLAELYGSDPILQRADGLFDGNSAFAAVGRSNTGGKKSGTQLVAAFERGERFWVGRNYGLLGRLMQGDLENNRWRTQDYETNLGASRPNRNWFGLDQFVELLHENGLLRKR